MERRISMNRFRSLAAVVVTLMLFGLAAAAQQNAPSSQSDAPAQQNQGSPVDQHMQLLTERLDLTADQQAKIRPIVQRMFEDRQKLDEDKSLSDAERHQKMMAMHDHATRQAKRYLNDDQKKKLDELFAERHKAHGN
jgi:ribonucleotide reductase alpha subunit